VPSQNEPRKILAERWRDFCDKVIPPDMADAEVERARKLFYAGAGTLLAAIMSILSPGGECTAADLAVMESINQELSGFADEKPFAGGRRAADPIWQQSGVNVKGEPFVQILLGERIAGQLTPETAREHGVHRSLCRGRWSRPRPLKWCSRSSARSRWRRHAPARPDLAITTL
jgi:hypothetical protein